MRRRGWAILCAAALHPASAAAQPAFLPPAADPSIPTLEAPELTELGGFTITLPGGTKPPTGAGGVQFMLNGLDIRGTTAFSGDDLAPMFADQLGQSITLDDLFAIVAEIEKTYRSAGYILSYAFLPPQESADGVFVIEVVEGYVNAVIYEGVDDPELLADLKPRFEPLLAERPIRLQSLEKALLGVDSGLGGFSVSGVLQPAEEGRGGSDLVVMAEKKSFDAVVSATNRGSDYAGPNRLSANANLYNVGTLGDRLAAALTFTQPGGEATGLSFGYSRPVDWVVPLVVSAAVAGAWSEPGADLEDFEVESRSLRFDLQGKAELWRTPENKFDLSVGTTWRKVDTKILGQRITRDRVGSIYAEGAYFHSGLWGGLSLLSARIERGLPFLDTSDAGDPKSRSDAESDFTYIQVAAVHDQPIWRGLSASLALTGQYSFDPLFASHEYALGGGGFGSAYDVGEAIGDHGAAGAFELRYDFTDVFDWLPRIQPYALVDGGVAFNIDEAHAETVASAGGGVRLYFPYGIDFGLQAVYAFGPEPQLDYDLGGRDLGRTRIIVGLRKRFEL